MAPHELEPPHAGEPRSKKPRGEARTEKRTLGVLMLVAGALSMWTVSPVWVPVFLGVLLASVASPLQRRLERRYRRHPRLLAAAISCLTVAIGVGLVVFLTYFVVRELLVYLTDVAPH